METIEGIGTTLFRNEDELIYFYITNQNNDYKLI